MEKGVQLIDARDKLTFAQGFIPGSINIQGNNSFANWCGWYLSYDKPFMLLANENQLEDLTRKLMRIGLDNILGYVPGIEEYVAAGGTLQTARVLDAEGLKSMMEKPDTQVVDLRGVSEYKSGHIQGADHVFVGTLPQNLDKVQRTGNVVVLCQGGDRASIGYSLLAREGFDNLCTYIPSMNDWVNRGNPVVS